MATRRVAKASTNDVSRASGGSLAQGTAAAQVSLDLEDAKKAVNLVAEELGRYLARSLRAEQRKGYSLPEAIIGFVLTAILVMVLWCRLSAH